MGLQHKAISGGIWNGLDSLGRQGLQFVVQLLLARLLVPADFGLVAVALSLNQFTNVLVGAGLVDAVIQKKDLGERDLSTAFWMSLGASGLSYLCLFCLAPFLADVFAMTELTWVIRVTAIMLVLDAVNNIQLSNLYRAMAFRQVFLINLPALLLSGAVGVGLALVGYGVWALVWHYVAVSFWRFIFALAATRWWPAFSFDLKVMRSFLRFSLGLIGLQFIDQLGRQIYVFVIGSVYTPAQLGYYNRAIALQQVSTFSVSAVVARVGLPVLSRLQEDYEQFLYALRKAMRLMMEVMTPILVGVAATSEALVPFLFGSQWEKVSPMLSALCVGGFIYVVGILNLQAIVAKGQTGLLFKVGLVTKAVQFIVLFLTYCYGLAAIVLGQVGSSLLGAVLSRVVTKRIVGYGHSAFLQDVSRPFLAAALMYAVVASMEGPLVLEIVVGAMVYGCYAWVMRFDSVQVLRSQLKALRVRLS